MLHITESGTIIALHQDWKHRRYHLLNLSDNSGVQLVNGEVDFLLCLLRRKLKQIHLYEFQYSLIVLCTRVTPYSTNTIHPMHYSLCITFTELLRTHTAYICVPVTSWWMMKPSQNGVRLLQLHLYVQKGAKCESGKYRPVSSLGAYFLSLWNFSDKRGISPLNSINILAWEQFRSGKRLLEVTIL